MADLLRNELYECVKISKSMDETKATTLVLQPQSHQHTINKMECI